MSKLTDLELEKRIADIEGVDVVIDDGGGWWTYVKSPGSAVKVLIAPYHPLTDKALLWDLMVKYKHEIDMDDCFIYTKDYDIPRTILECIVEANNEN